MAAGSSGGAVTVTSPEHPSQLMRQMLELYEQQQLTDVVLVVQGQRLRAHSAVLTAFSLSFKHLLQNRQTVEIVELEVDNVGATLSCWHSLLEFLYTGSVELTTHTVGQLEDAAGQLQINSLLQLCQQYSSNTCSVEVENLSKTELPVLLKQELDLTSCVQESPGGAEITPSTPVVKQETLSLADCAPQTSDLLENAVDADQSEKLNVAPIRKRGRPRKDSVENKRKRGRPRKVPDLRNTSSGTNPVSASEPQDDDSPSHSNLHPEIKRKRGRPRKDLQSRLAGYKKLKLRATAAKKVSRKPKKAVSSLSVRKVGPKKTKPLIEEKDLFSCEECGKKFRRDLHLRLHKYSHVPETSYTCRHCGTVTEEWMDYKTHLAKHGLTMAEIEKEQEDPESVPLHPTRVSEDGEVTWLCSLCDALTQSVGQMVEHTKLMHPDSKHSCSQCYYKSPVKFCVEKHIMVKHAKGLVCDICNKQFVWPRQLMQHKHKRHEIRDDKIKLHYCPVEGCKYFAYIKAGLAQHNRNVHKQDYNYMCDTCGRAFKARHSLDDHIKRRHTKIKDHRCEQCGKDFTDRSHLKRHVDDVHNSLRQYQCEICTYGTNYNTRFRNHMLQKHQIQLTEDTPVFSCPHCDFQTTAKCWLNKHMPIHDTEPILPCPHCDRKCRTAYLLASHIKHVHQPRDYPCQFNDCDFAAPTKDKLRAHTWKRHTHPNYKPIKCAYCDFLCGTSGNCRKHIMKRHPDQEVRYIRLGSNAPADLFMPWDICGSNSKGGESGQTNLTQPAAIAVPVHGHV